MTFEGGGPFSGDFESLENVPEIPKGLNASQVGDILDPALQNKAEVRTKNVSNDNTLTALSGAFVSVLGRDSGELFRIDSTNTTASYSEVNNNFEDPANLYKSTTTVNQVNSDYDSFADNAFNSNLLSSGSAADDGSSANTFENSNSFDMSISADSSSNSSKGADAVLLTENNVAELTIHIDSVSAGGFDGQFGYDTNIFILPVKNGTVDVDELNGSATIRADEEVFLNVIDVDENTGDVSRNDVVWNVKHTGNGNWEVVNDSGTVLATGSGFKPDPNTQIGIELSCFVADGSADGNLVIDRLGQHSKVLFDDGTQLETDVVAETDSNIKKVYVPAGPDLKVPTGTSLTVDISVDGGSNFDITNAPLNEVIDTTQVANPGNQLVLRYNISVSDRGKSPIFESIGAKVWD